jgi:membrane-associated phospholipid phosphatase
LSVVAGTDVDPERAPTARHRTRPTRLLLLALAAGIVMVIAYVVFMRTFPGQRLDDLAFEGRKATYLSARRASTFLVRHLTIPAVLAGVALILVMAARRGTWRAGAVAVASIGASVLGARLLKLLLPRPELSELANATYDNTFPSGHSAAVMATALAVLSVGGDAFRRTVMPLAVVGVVGYSAAMVGSGWHRPSDVGGGLMLAVVVVSVATALRVLREGPVVLVPLGWQAQDLGRLVLAVSVVPAVLVMTVNNPPSDPRYSLGLYVASVVAAAVLGTLGVLGFVAAMGRSSPAEVSEAGTTPR